MLVWLLLEQRNGFRLPMMTCTGRRCATTHPLQGCVKGEAILLRLLLARILFVAILRLLLLHLSPRGEGVDTNVVNATNQRMHSVIQDDM